MMNINFYVKSMGSFIILSIMWYERLTKCYLLHIDPSEFKELGKTCQATCFLLSTLNHWTFTEHTSWPSKPRLPNSPDETHKLGSWAKKMRLCAMCHAPNPVPGFVTMTGMLISSLNLILTRTNLTFWKLLQKLSSFFSFLFLYSNYVTFHLTFRASTLYSKE